MKKIFELADGARFMWNGETYIKGRHISVRGSGSFYLCKPTEAQSGKPAIERPFSANLDVDEVAE